MNKRLIILMLMSCCGAPAACYISERDMDACFRLCMPNGVRTYDNNGCHCNTDVVTLDGGR